MLLEFGVGAAILTASSLIYDKVKNKDITRLRKDFFEIIWNANNSKLKNKENIVFHLGNVYRKNYGYFATVIIPKGCSFEALENAKDIIQDGLGCLIELNKENFEDFATIKIVNHNFQEVSFAPVKTKDYQLFLGWKLDGSPMLLDLKTDAHLLIAGKTRFGKSFLFACVIANICYSNPNNWEIYMFQVMKGEIDVFANCKPVKACTNDVRQILSILKKLRKEVDNRSKLHSQNGVRNIGHWNETFPKKKMKRILVCAEELSFFLSNEDEELSEVQKIFTGLVKAGASAGVHFVGLVQRTTVANMSAETKSQMSVASTRQRSSIDSQNAIGTNDATKLKMQEFIVGCNKGDIRFRVPNIDEDFKTLNKYVPEIKIPKLTEEPNMDLKNKLNNNNNNGTVLKSTCMKIDKNTPKETIKEEPKITDRNLIRKFLEQHGAITSKMAMEGLGIKKQSTYKELSKLEKEGDLKTYTDSWSKLKVYYTKKEPLSTHNLIKLDFYCKLLANGYEIISHDNEKIFLEGKYRSDGLFKVKKNGKLSTIILEVDYEHPTHDAKLTDYEQVYKDMNFILVLSREKIGAKIKRKYPILATDFKFSNINLLENM